MERNCKYCGELFEPKRKDTFYCSQSCRQMAYLSRKLDAPISLEGLNIVSETSKTELSVKQEALKNDDPSNESAKRQLTDQDAKDNDSGNEQNVSKEILLPLPKQEQNDRKEIEFTEYKSSFIDEITDLTNSRDYVAVLHGVLYNNEVAEWVSIRYRCLLEALLTLSEMKRVEPDDLKELCNAFTALIQCKYFPHLPQRYPYTDEILELRETLKNICLQQDEDVPFEFSIKRETRQHLIASRWELSTYVPKIKFSELQFS